MKFEKKLSDLSKLAEWGIKGIYNEYGLERSFCSCGYVADKKIYVCPECGNTEFAPTRDWNGHLIERPSQEITFAVSPSDSKPLLVSKRTWLKAHRSTVDPTIMHLSEEDINETVFRLGGYFRVPDVDKELLREAIRKHAKKFGQSLERAIPIMDALSIPIENANQFLASTSNCSDNFLNLANELLESNELVLLNYLIEKHRDSCWHSVEEELIAAGVPSFLWKERNNLNVLRAFPDRCYGRSSAISVIEGQWAKLPMDIQNSILLYLRQGLITATQMQNMVFFNEDLLKENPEAMAKAIRKYFANFRSAGYIGYGRTVEQTTISDMYNFYKDEGLPVTSETFDFRSWRAMVNTKTVHEAGYDPGQVDGILEGMDKSPIDTLLALGKLRRPRKKKTP